MSHMSTVTHHNAVVVCTDLSGKKLHIQVGAGTVVTSGSLCSVMVSTLARNSRGVDSIPAVGAILPIFITPTTMLLILVALTCLTHSLSVIHSRTHQRVRRVS